MSLPEFLARAGARPFAYGSFDCLLWLADWAVERGHADPAADLRGRYRTRLGCARILKREGGAVALVSRCCKAVGLKPAESPGLGAIGLVKAPTARGRLEEVGGIFTGRRWAMLGVGGLVCMPAEVLAAWEV